MGLFVDKFYNVALITSVLILLTQCIQFATISGINVASCISLITVTNHSGIYNNEKNINSSR